MTANSTMKRYFYMQWLLYNIKNNARVLLARAGFMYQRMHNSGHHSIITLYSFTGHLSRALFP